MSASEKLRVLAASWYAAPEDPIYGAKMVRVVGDALPLIADVVEAAETEVPQLRQRVLERAMEQRERDGLGFAMDGSPTLAALTALRDALQDSGVTGGDRQRPTRTPEGSPPPPEGATAPSPDPRLVVRKNADGAALEGDTP